MACGDETGEEIGGDTVNISAMKKLVKSLRERYDGKTLQELYALIEDAPEEGVVHRTHDTRYSDSSVCDEICELCGTSDRDGMKRLEQPCPKARKKEPDEKIPAVEMADLLKELDGCFCDDYGQSECRRCGEIRARMLELENSKT